MQPKIFRWSSFLSQSFAYLMLNTNAQAAIFYPAPPQTLPPIVIENKIESGEFFIDKHSINDEVLNKSPFLRAPKLDKALDRNRNPTKWLFSWLKGGYISEHKELAATFPSHEGLDYTKTTNIRCQMTPRGIDPALVKNGIDGKQINKLEINLSQGEITIELLGEDSAPAANSIHLEVEKIFTKFDPKGWGHNIEDVDYGLGGFTNRHYQTLTVFLRPGQNLVYPSGDLAEPQVVRIFYNKGRLSKVQFLGNQAEESGFHESIPPKGMGLVSTVTYNSGGKAYCLVEGSSKDPGTIRISEQQ